MHSFCDDIKSICLYSTLKNIILDSTLLNVQKECINYHWRLLWRTAHFKMWHKRIEAWDKKINNRYLKNVIRNIFFQLWGKTCWIKLFASFSLAEVWMEVKVHTGLSWKTGGFRLLMTSISSLVTFRHKGKLIYLAKTSVRTSDLYDFTVFKVLQINYNSWFKQTVESIFVQHDFNME